MRSRIVAAATASVLAAGLGLAGPAAGGARTAGVAPAAADQPTSAGTRTIGWHSCPGAGSGPYAEQCANLKVPMDYTDPTAGTVTLALSRVRHHSSHYKGAMLVNFGGPGEPGLDGDILQGSVPGGVGNDYDWIGWDPRGVGSSRPAIRCQTGYFDAPRRSYVPRTKHLLSYWLKRTRSYAHACATKYPKLLQHMTTEDSARDMDAIRQGLGLPRISYYGFSYGTYLGQVYSTLFPSHVKRMVLDSNVDPRRVWYGANLDQDKAFDRNIRIWFGWLAKYHSVYHLGTTRRAVTRRYFRDLRSVTRHPRGKLGPAEWVDAFTGAAYYQSTWVELADAWKAYAKHGHTGPLLSEYADEDIPGDDNTFAVYNAVQCTDTAWPPHWSRWQRDNDRYAKKYPFLTWSNAWFNAPCLYWGAAPHTPVTIDGSRTGRVLLIDEKLDAATPYSGSLQVRSLYPKARLIAEPGGTTHADSLNGDRCVDNHVASYLKNGSLPRRRSGRRADLNCRPISAPDPRHDSVRLGPAFSASRTARR